MPINCLEFDCSLVPTPIIICSYSHFFDLFNLLLPDIPFSMDDIIVLISADISCTYHTTSIINIISISLITFSKLI